MDVWIGVDVGSISTKAVALNRTAIPVALAYLPTASNPINALKKCLKILKDKMPEDVDIRGVASTGTGRKLASFIVGADTVINEISAQALAALHFFPDTQTVIEIGGQDSKLIIIRDNLVVNFAMNNICAAGTGSFLDHQAVRLGIPIGQFGELALKSKTKVDIAGRCTVFAETDMVHKTQLGYKIEDIINGLCRAVVRNYLSSIGRGKEILPPILFQGGVAANAGIRKNFEEVLRQDIIVPQYHMITGAIGAALWVKRENPKNSRFRDFELIDAKYQIHTYECQNCVNQCELAQVRGDGAYYLILGNRCESYQVIS